MTHCCLVYSIMGWENTSKLDFIHLVCRGQRPGHQSNLITVMFRCQFMGISLAPFLERESLAGFRLRGDARQSSQLAEKSLKWKKQKLGFGWS